MNDSAPMMYFMLTAFVLGFLAGGTYAKKTSEAKAVQSKVAEYYIDKNNNKQFRFKEIK